MEEEERGAGVGDDRARLMRQRTGQLCEIRDEEEETRCCPAPSEMNGAKRWKLSKQRTHLRSHIQISVGWRKKP